MIKITPIVKQLIIINILFFVCSQFVGEDAYKLLSMYYFENENFKYWQIFTSIFMHAPMPNFLNILFAMLALYSLGSVMENVWGGQKFLFFYLSCGIGAALLHQLISYYQFHHGLNILLENGFVKADILNYLNESKVDTRWTELLSPSGLNDFGTSFAIPIFGSTTAITGLLVAYAITFPNAELIFILIPFPIKAKYFVPGILILDLILGLYGSSIFGISGFGILAKLSGALFGFIITWFWNKGQANHNRWN